MARGPAKVVIDADGYAWGDGDELLDGTVCFINGQFHYDTFRGRSARAERLYDALLNVAKQLGYERAYGTFSTAHG